eukprot:GFUD01014745.1.p1 GENE.GFUD01014745.1~~GFUD01014745.1.p1  ORF type:complete len:284 (+),score=67.51 GFUD01014745.1:109-852(+)
MTALSKKIGLVTGANSGIGLATARHLFDEGVTVVAVDKDTDQLEEQQNFHVKQVNLLEESEIANLFQWIRSDLGGLDIVVNVAGIGTDHGILDGNYQEWMKMIQVNLLAPTLCSKLAMEVMVDKCGGVGHVVNMQSVWSHAVPKTEHVHWYSVTKYGLKSMTDGLRIEVANRKLDIRISTVSPGPTESNFNINSFKTQDKVDQTFGTNRAFPRLDPTEVSAAVVHILKTPKNVQINDMIITPQKYVF